MRQFFTTHPWASFTLCTAIYVVIILALVYLYGYSGVSNSKFIYNEF
ncbi:teichoic acid D-Ala incorporation-associated protein DltX [Secundilactobacillus oryzae]|nr:teichoic acid D-Ala incorporation-associated protein DltX [Secundilactobacillus oryzae]